MIHYTFSYTQANSHYIDIEVLISECKGNSLQLQLPSWRPGRYELGNFAKNVKGFQVEDLHSNKLPFRKKTKDLWEIETGGASMIKAKYSYYAA
ncbi:MAG: M61 family peptidase, partial [Bacteroidota bacterium]